MNKLYAVVLWCDEPNSYSAVKISRILYDREIIKNETHFIDQIFEIALDKDGEEVYPGKVLHVGSRAKMSQMAADMASDVADTSVAVNEEEDQRRSKRLSKKRKTSGALKHTFIQEAAASSSTTASQRNGSPSVVLSDDQREDPIGEEDLAATNLVASDVEEVEENGHRCEKDEIITELKSKLRRKERRISKLKKDLAQLQQAEETEMEDIGEGLLIPKALAEELKSDYRHNPGVFLRKLMEKSKLFTLQEIANSSLTGQKHHSGSSRPRLDPQRFRLCKEFTIKKCKLKEDTIRMVHFQKSITNICTDARKRLKKQGSNNASPE